MASPADFCIEIRYNRLLPRLVELKQVPTDWRERLGTVQATLEATYKQLLPDTVSKCNPSSDAPLDYTMTKCVCETLSEGASRSLFGGLIGEAATWKKLVQAYEKRNLWLVEAAQHIERSVDGSLPDLKKRVGAAQQQLQALERRADDCARAANTAAKRFAEECASLGLQAVDDLAGDARALALGLPEALGPLVEALRDKLVRDGVHAYEHCVRANGGDKPLQTLVEIMNGDVVFEGLGSYEYADASVKSACSPGQPHSSSNAPGAAQQAQLTPILDLDEPVDGTAREAAPTARRAELARPALDHGVPPAIDLAVHGAEPAGCPVATPGGAGETCAGGSTPGDAPAAAEVDDRRTNAGGSEWQTDGAGGAETKQWDITVESGAGDGVAGNGMIAACTDHTAEDTSNGPKALLAAALAAEASLRRLAYDSAFRAALVADVHELRGFLLQRVDAATKGVVEGECGKDADHVVLKASCTALEGALAVLDGTHVQLLLGIVTSPRYLQRFVNELTMRSLQERKMWAAHNEVVKKMAEVREQVASCQAKQQEQAAYLKSLCEKVVSALSSQLHKQVRLTGEVCMWI